MTVTIQEDVFQFDVPVDDAILRKNLMKIFLYPKKIFFPTINVIIFLAPTGAQERLICVRSFVRPSKHSLSKALILHL